MAVNELMSTFLGLAATGGPGLVRPPPLLLPPLLLAAGCCSLVATSLAFVELDLGGGGGGAAFSVLEPPLLC